ncbi:hypothetical protein [Cellulosimicrobium protaetiae]|jgi:hypothetical protein
MRIVALLCVLAMASACSGEEPPAPSATSIAIDAFLTSESTLEPPPEGTSQVLIDTAAHPPQLTMTLWGSTSCPAFPTAIGWLDSSTLEITMRVPDGSQGCTADLSPYSHVIVLPEGGDASGVEFARIGDEKVPVAFKEDQ